MSLFNWLSPKKNAKHDHVHHTPDSSGLSRMESTKPYSASRGLDSGGQHGLGQPANRKKERMAQRELLYGVVRDAMTHAGVLTANYKFKVLSLDSRGRQFLVMVDLSQEPDGGTRSLAEIEAAVAQAAKSRHGIMVTSVYWRMAEHVAVGAAAVNHGRPASRPAAPVAAAAPSAAVSAASAAAAVAPAPHAPVVPYDKPIPPAQPLMATLATDPEPPVAATDRHGGRFEPIHASEVEAFRQALAAGVSGADHMGNHGASARGFDGSMKHGPQSYTLLTGFEDTELAEDDGPPQVLSATQYGDIPLK